MITALSEKDIILAEDDADDVYIFELAMKEMEFPYSLRHAEDGDVLFVLLRDKIPYMLFLDINMPCRDGVSCLMQIRRERQYDRLPIIVYTGHFTNKLVDATFRGGANLYLTKTRSFAELVIQLNRVFAINWAEQLYYPPQPQFVLS